MYELTTKNDLAAGNLLVARVPEEDIDRKALYTIQAAPPEFVVPFRFKSVDGQLEFTYTPGSRSRLQYFYGKRNAREYAELWESLLNPLLECDDWFMKPFSFVLKPEHIFFDKNTGKVSYIYIPSRIDASDAGALRQMVSEMATSFDISDTALKNKVLMSILQEFNPKEFLQMLKPYRMPVASVENTPPVRAAAPQPLSELPRPASAAIVKPETPSAPKAEPVPEDVSRPLPSVQARPGDLQINLQGGVKAPKGKDAKKAPKKPLFGAGKKSEPKSAPEPKPQKQKSGLFGGGGKKGAAAGIMIGAAAPSQLSSQDQPAERAQYAPAPVLFTMDDDGDKTQIDDDMAQFTGLRLVSNLDLPQRIEVRIEVGKRFSIGRFDVTRGVKQSDFEFDKSTKGVSRHHHAVIERTSDGYYIVDTGSSAGTFVNGKKLVPNAPFQIAAGDKLSFGNAGADYVWEC
jgi:hypothetical protein